jgi:hypothetical protein
MRGLGAFRTGAVPGGVLAGPWVRDSLWRDARAVPSLDLQFANKKSLSDGVTSQNLVSFTRASIGTFVGSDGLIKTATTNEPRFDHDPTTLESLGLLVEEARTNAVVRSSEFNVSPWVASNVTVTPNAVTAPDGTLTADLLTSTSSNGFVEQVMSYTRTTNSTGTFSVYLRANANVSLPIQVSLTEAQNGEQVALVSITANVTTQWQRFTGTYTVPANQFGGGYRFVSPRIGGSSSFTTGEQVYAWGFQDEAGFFPTSYIPTTTATVTRAADVASISGSNFGTNRTNLLTRTESINDAAWVKSAVVVTQDSITAPNQIINADKSISNTSNNYHYNSTPALSSALTNGASYTYSVYLKSAGYNYVLINTPQGTTAGNSGPIIDLSNGTVAGHYTSTYPTTVTAINNGWYRVQITFVSTGGTTFYVDHNQLPTSSVGTYAGDNASGIYIWGAQLETGTVASTYIPSTDTFTSRASTATFYDANGIIQTAGVNVSRNGAFLPDSSGVFRSAGPLLLEPAATNGLIWSESFDNAAWIKDDSTIASNLIAAPDGTITADKIQENNANNIHYVYQSFPLSSITYTLSVYLKAAERSIGWIYFYNGANANVYFDLSTGTVLSTTGTGSPVASIASVGNGWYRCVLTATSPTGSGGIGFGPSITSSTNSYTGTTGFGIYAWGAQFETGAVATSYIPTVASTVTRAADVSTSTATTRFESSWFNTSTSTIYSDCQGSPATTTTTNTGGGYPYLFSFAQNPNNRFVGLRSAGTNNGSWGVYSNPSDTFGYSTNANFNSIRNHKVGGAYNASSYQAFADGVMGGSVTPGATPSAFTALSIGSGTDGGYWNGAIKRLTYWPSRLENITLQNITSPAINYDPDAAAYIAAVEAADGQPLESFIRAAFTNFIVGCKQDNIWSAIKASCILAGARTLSGALVPLAGTAPTSFNFVSGDYDRKTGLVGNGSTKYLASNRNENADPQNSNHNAVWLSTYTSGDQYPLGSGSGNGNNFLLARNSAAFFRNRFDGDSNGESFAATGSQFPGGLFGMSRSSSSSVNVTYKQNAGQVFSSNSRNSFSPASATIDVFRQAGTYSNTRLAFYSIGESVNLALLDTRVTRLIADISFGINTGLIGFDYNIDTLNYINAGYAAGGTLA